MFWNSFHLRDRINEIQTEATSPPTISAEHLLHAIYIICRYPHTPNRQPQPQRPEAIVVTCDHLQVCPFIRLSTRLYELACPRDISISIFHFFKLNLNTLKVKSSNEFDHGCHSYLPNMAFLNLFLNLDAQNLIQLGIY